MDLQDPKSASVSAQAKHDCSRELAEGELASCPRGFPARKRQRANKGRGMDARASDTRLCGA